MQDLLSALALVLVLEGLLPFVSPRQLKASVAKILLLPENVLRFIGLASMIAGVILLSLVR